MIPTPLNAYEWCHAAHKFGNPAKHRLIDSQVLLKENKIDRSEFDFLLRFPIVLNVVSPVDFLNNVSWGGIKALANMDQFRNFDKDIEVSALILSIFKIQ